MKSYTVVIPLVILLGGCTYNVSVMHTEGQASDMIDETQTANPNITPSLNIPVKPL